MPDAHCHLLLPKMIAEYYQLAKTRNNAITGDSRWMNQPEFKQAKASLCKAIDPKRENSIIGACTWWLEHQKQFVSEVQRIRHLWQLLKELDRIYSALPLLCGGGLILGRRWWNIAARCDKGRPRSGFLDGPALTRSYEFPHLRVVDIDYEEWIERGRTKQAFEHVVTTNKLRVGLCALSGKAKTFFNGTRVLPSEDNTVGFRAREIRFLAEPAAAGDETRPPDLEALRTAYREELRHAVRWAHEERIHILCFPELCVCEKGREILRAEIESTPGELSLVIAGSYHVNTGPGADRAANTSPVWLVTEGRVQPLRDYQKIDLMSVEMAHLPKDGEAGPLHSVVELARSTGCEWAKEDVSQGDAGLLVDTPIGVVAIAICKDLLWSDKTPLRKYDDVADHLLVVSMNAAPDWFWFPAQKLSRLGTGVFYVNTPQLVASNDSETEIAFWHLPKLRNAGATTRVCYNRTAPTGEKRGREQRGMDDPAGRIICSLDFTDPRFLELMTEP